MKPITIDYKNMMPDERREYHRRKQCEYYERRAAIEGREVCHHNPDSHPTLMTPEERRVYNLECQRRYLKKLKSTIHGQAKTSERGRQPHL